jgi:predicted dehydrogenase
MSLSIGLIGCGKWGRHILRDLKLCGARVHVVARSAASRGNAAAHRPDSIVSEVSDLPPVDGYIIAVPSSLHAEIIEALLPSGQPIFTEKPLGIDPVQARRIVDKGGDRVFVMDKWRYHPGIEHMRQEIAAGGMGRLRAIRIQRWGWGRAHADVTAVWVLLPHDLSILLHWLGEVPPLHWVCRTVPEPVDGGLIAHLGGGAAPPITIDMSITAPDHRRTFTIIGTEATMELADSYDTAILVRRGEPAAADAAVERIEIGQDMPLLREIQAFLAHLEGGPPPMTPAREALLVVERCAEIEAALRTAEPA